MGISRRDALKLTGAVAATAAVGAYAADSAPAVAKTFGAAPLPKATGPRVVVVGGGPAGLTVAKYVKKGMPKANVVLVERRNVFMSGFVSNLVATGQLPLQFITHDFLQGARNNKYTYLWVSVYNIDKAARTLYTSEGTVTYDYLVLAPGVDYDYSKWTKGDITLETQLRQEYPGAFIPGSETLTLQSKITDFEGGTFLLNVPGGNYRCLPGPYERACLLASLIKKNNIKGKVILLDENPDITIKKDGFHSVMTKLYKDQLEYVPSSPIESINLEKKIVSTPLGDVSFTDASFYPRVRGGKLLEIAGVAKDTAFNKMEANIDPFTYMTADPHIFACGDARPMPFSKSANTANSEGQYVASLVVKLLNGKSISKADWKSPHTTCYSAVGIEPIRAISVNADYAYDDGKKSFGFANASTMEDWSSDKGQAAGLQLMSWAKGLYADFFN